MISIAYFRVYWRFVELEQGVYNWEMLDKALQTAHVRHQTLQLAITPYGTGPDSDVPGWYRKITGEVLRQNPKAVPIGTGVIWQLRPSEEHRRRSHHAEEAAYGSGDHFRAQAI